MKLSEFLIVSGLIIIVALFMTGCVGIMVLSGIDISGSYKTTSENLPPKYVATVVPSSKYSCFAVYSTQEEDYASGSLGRDILDMRKVTGVLKNTCYKIMATSVGVEWSDGNGKGKYYGIPTRLYTLKPGETIEFEVIGRHPQGYGYLEETEGWTYRIMVN